LASDGDALKVRPLPLLPLELLQSDESDDVEQSLSSLSHEAAESAGLTGGEEDRHECDDGDAGGESVGEALRGDSLAASKRTSPDDGGEWSSVAPSSCVGTPKSALACLGERRTSAVAMVG